MFSFVHSSTVVKLIPSPLSGEKVRMRGEKSKCFIFLLDNPHPGPLPILGEGICLLHVKAMIRIIYFNASFWLSLVNRHYML